MPVKVPTKKQPKANKQAEATPGQLHTKSTITPVAQNNKGLPDGWKWVKLTDTGKVISGGTPSTSEPSFWSDDVHWITPADLSGYSGKFITKGRKSISKKGLENSSAKLLPKGSVLFSSRAPIGYVAIASGELATNQGFKNIIPSKDVHSDFLYYYLKASKQLAEKYASGTTFKEISGTKFGDLPFPLPPLPEQHAIVSKIEELLSELDKGKQQLETAQQQLKIYRQAVLKWAFEGKLTNKNVKEGELPKGWKSLKLVDVAAKITDGEHFRPKTQETGVPFLSAKDIRDDGVSFADPLYISKETAEKALQRCNPEKGDILIVSRGATVGRMCIVNTDSQFCLLGSVILIMVTKGFSNKYINYVLKSPSANQKMIAVSGATAQQAIYLRDIKNIEIPVCSTEEQHFIVQEIESRLSVCDKVEETIINSLVQAETLRQSILKKAFEGKLISQVELENIRTLSLPLSITEVLSIAAEPKVEYKKNKQVQVPFPRKIEGISTTDLHAGVLAIVIGAHEKSKEHHLKLSHVKGEKIAHLVEAYIGIELGRIPQKDAAGPDDFPHLKKVESRAIKSNWFGIKRLEIGQTYFSKSGMPRIIQKLKSSVPDEDFKKIETLVQTFLPFELEHAEVIATVYAGWNNLLLEGKTPTDEEIVYESRENWSKRKLGIERASFFKALKWMKEHGYVPLGNGKMVAGNS